MIIAHHAHIVINVNKEKALLKRSAFSLENLSFWSKSAIIYAVLYHIVVMCWYGQI
jgi:hypothetical protein